MPSFKSEREALKLALNALTCIVLKMSYIYVDFDILDLTNFTELFYLLFHTFSGLLILFFLTMFFLSYFT